jgi:hypothetical protein
MATTKIDRDQVYVATTSFARSVPGEPPLVVRQGQRLRGSALAVQRHPELFALDGMDDAELEALRAERHQSPPAA